METLINYTQPETLDQLYNVHPFAPKKELKRMITNFKNADEKIEEYEKALEKGVEAVKVFFNGIDYYDKNLLDIWVGDIKEWKTGSVKLEKITNDIQSVREAARAYIGAVSAFAGLYQHAKVLDYARSVFEGVEGDEWVSWAREEYKKRMEEPITYLWSSLEEILTYMNDLNADDLEEIEREYDTPIDMLYELLTPYVQQKYLDLCIGC